MFSQVQSPSQDRNINPPDIAKLVQSTRLTNIANYLCAITNIILHKFEERHINPSLSLMEVDVGEEPGVLTAWFFISHALSLSISLLSALALTKLPMVFTASFKSSKGFPGATLLYN
jgi:hypothetical protein